MLTIFLNLAGFYHTVHPVSQSLFFEHAVADGPTYIARSVALHCKCGQ